MMKPYQTILNKYYHRGYFEDAELADLLDCSRKRISEVRKGNSDIWAWELLVLQPYFAQSGRNDLAQLSFPEDHRMYQIEEMKINGHWSDERQKIINQTVHADQKADDRQFDQALEHLGKVRKLVDQMEAEIKNAKG